MPGTSGLNRADGPFNTANCRACAKELSKLPDKFFHGDKKNVMLAATVFQKLKNV